MFKELTDSQWNALKAHIPKPDATGRPRADDRTTINAVIFVPITGCRWIDLPAKYGSESSAHRRFQNFQQKGVWEKILAHVIKSAQKQDKINLRYIQLIHPQFLPKKGG